MRDVAEMEAVSARLEALFVGDVDLVDSIELLQLRDRALLLRDKVKRDTDALKSRADATRAEVDERLGRTNVILDEAQPPTVIRNTPKSLLKADRARHTKADCLDTTLAIDLGDGDVKVVRRTNTEPVRRIKGQRPRIATAVS